MSGQHSLEHLAAEAKHARQRLDLYRAKVYGPRATSEGRLRELQRVSDGAHERLASARAAAQRAAGDRPPS